MTKALVKQADLTRILKAYEAAGKPIAKTEITRDGRVIVYTTEEAAKISDNDWDQG